MRDVFTPAFRRAWAANFFSDLGFALLVHYPGFLKQLGAGETLIGAVAGFAGLVAVLARPGVGQALDRLGRRRVIVTAAVMRVVAAALFFTVGSIGPWVFVVRALYGLGLAVVFTGLFAYAADVVTPARRTQSLALFGLSGLVPGMFGAALGDLVIGLGGFDALFLLVMLLDLVLLATALRLDPVMGLSTAGGKGGFLRILRVHTLRPVWVLVAVFGVAFGGVQTFMRTFVDDVGIGTVGLFFACYSTTAVVLRLTLSSLPDRLGHTRVLYPAVGSLVAGMAMLATTDRVADLVVAAALAGTGHAFIFPILSGMVVERAPQADRGSGIGVFTATFDVATITGVPVLGAVIERVGYPAMFVAVAAVVVAGAVLFLRGERALAVQAREATAAA